MTESKKKTPAAKPKKAAVKKAPAKKSAKSEPVLQLPEVVDVSYAQKLYSDLKSLIEKSKELIILDGERVKKLTTPGVQILLAAGKLMDDKNGKMLIREPSENMEDAFADLGFSVQLNEWNEKNG